MNTLHMLRPMTIIGCIGLLAAIAGPAHAQSSQDQRQWLEQLDPADRAPLRRLIGQAPPQFTGDLAWHNSDDAPSWQQLSDKVVVIQSWSHGDEVSRIRLEAVLAITSKYSEMDVQTIALHTPSQAEKAADYLADTSIKAKVAIDPVGRFCDELGVYKTPVNVVVDRHGAVRYAGLTPEGLDEAINRLIDEMYDPARCPGPRTTGAADDDFPPHSGSVGSAIDRRGQKAPDFSVSEWVTDQPSPDGKVVLLAYWATWCGPCIRTIPRLNQFAERFGEDLVVIGVSDEARDRLDAGMRNRNLPPESFKYSIGTDPAGSMKRQLGIRGIPHATVMCSDWIVRWQGHPGTLNEQTLEQIISADRGGEMPRRWVSR